VQPRSWAKDYLEQIQLVVRAGLNSGSPDPKRMLQVSHTSGVVFFKLRHCQAFYVGLIAQHLNVGFVIFYTMVQETLPPCFLLSRCLLCGQEKETSSTELVRGFLQTILCPCTQQEKTSKNVRQSLIRKTVLRATLEIWKVGRRLAKKTRQGRVPNQVNDPAPTLLCQRKTGRLWFLTRIKGHVNRKIVNF